jgi:hypothetical protein
MTLQQALQSDSKRVRELFEKIENTSDNAIRTRENLYGDLSRDLRLHADIEEQDLLPALRRNDETKELARDVAKRNRELRAKLDEVDGLAKSDPSFRELIGELRKLFEQQLRDERAGQRGLTPEQREKVDERIEAQRTQAEEQRIAEDEERREEARRQSEHRRAAAARSEAAEQVSEATRRTAREVAHAASDRAHEGASALRNGSQKAAVGTAKAARKVRDAASDTLTGYRETVRENREDMKALAGAVRNFSRVGSELRSIVVNSMKQSARNRIDMAVQVVRSPLKYGQLQREYAAAASRNRIETVAGLMQIVRSASSAARLPLEERLRTVA